jgi:RING-variant domain/MORN repeat variant
MSVRQILPKVKLCLNSIYNNPPAGRSPTTLIYNARWSKKLILKLQPKKRKMDQVVCYICFEPDTKENPYVTNPRPCPCKGSIEIHQQCLEQLLKASRHCSICKSKYHLKYLPKREGKELICIVQGNRIIEYTVNESGQKHGSYYIKTIEGRTLIIHSYINGIMDGPYVEYYPNGQIRSACRCKNNKIEGEYTEWYEDGAIKEESHYENGKKHGECIEWIREGYSRVSTIKQYDQGEEIY